MFVRVPIPSGSKDDEMEAGFAPAHLPIVREYASRMGFVKIVDKALACDMRVSPGKILLALVMNVLSGRSPLYRVEEFFRTRDVALLLGSDMTVKMLNDDAIGRVLDRIYEYGTWKIFSEVCVQAFRAFSVDASVVHHDTTSVSVWGEYAPAPHDPICITNGFSKDKRPDLKQFMLSLLLVEGNLPCHGGILDGNASDKKTNGKILHELPRIMARHGKKEFIYVADAALATKENLSLMGDTIRFITRLPANFGVCGRLIGKAVALSSWQEVGPLSHRTVKGKEVSWISAARFTRRSLWEDVPCDRSPLRRPRQTPTETHSQGGRERRAGGVDTSQCTFAEGVLLPPRCKGSGKGP